jgi:iron complex transport system substrate-binding protein
MKQADFMPLEKMLADPPEVILAAGDSHAEEDRLLSHPALGSLNGTRRARLDPALLWCGGPTIIRAAQRLAQVRESL